MPRILVLTTEPLPIGDLPATGAGLRAWGLAEGLRTRGLDVRLLMPVESVATYAGAALESLARELPPWVGLFRRAELRATMTAENPDVLVLQHWGLARELGEVTCPLAIDLAGPHLLERQLWGSPQPQADLREKLDALRRADFLTCSGRLQRLYFLPYLALAGWEVAPPEALPVIPFCFAPLEPAAPLNPQRLVYGGFFLPWQDPSLALETALRALDELPAGAPGELLFVGGPHPGLDVARGRFEPLLARLTQHPRVRVLPPMSFQAYARLLGEGGVALDLMARNAERELAFTTRTVLYLAAGLPVIHDNYSELGEIIADAGAGWALDADDPAALLDLLREILAGRIDLAPRAAAARALSAGPLHWATSIGPLAEFCAAPAFRPGKMVARLDFEEQGTRLLRAEADLLAIRSAHATLHGKRWVRWGLSLTSRRSWLRLPLTLLTALIALALYPLFWFNDHRPRA